MKRCYDNILELIGDTPLVRLNRLNPNPRVAVYVKLEYFNPGGSIKDRVAWSMLQDAEDSGRTHPGQNRHRGHQRQYRHRPGHGLRRQRLSLPLCPCPNRPAKSASSSSRPWGPRSC